MIYIELFIWFSIAFALIWIAAGFATWGVKWFCYHDLETGKGVMGDGVDCRKCGLSTYDGFDSHLWIFKLLGRVNRRMK